MSAILKHVKFEFFSILRHPEQLLLLAGTPIAALILLRNQSDTFFLALAISILASNFTSIAINTSFARRYGTLKYLAITPVGKTGIWVAQFLVGCLSLMLQVPILIAGSKFLHFEVSSGLSSLITVPLLIGFSSSLAFLFSSVMSAEKVLAFANVFFIAIAGTGVYLANSSYAYLHPLAGILTTGTSQLINIALVTTATLAIIAINFKKFEWID